MKRISHLRSDDNQPAALLNGKQPRFKIVLRALRHRNYRLFFSGQIISLIGTWIQMTAQPWLVYRLTHSSFWLGVIGFTGPMPVFLLACIGGTIADRYNRHRIVIAMQTASMILAFVLSLLTLTETVKMWHILVLSILLGIVNAFDMPGRQAFIVELVEKKDLMNAIALNSSIFNGARIVGPAVAGVLIAGIGEGWCFFANGVSYLAVIAGLLLMRLKPREAAGSNSPGLKNVLDGFSYVWRTKPIRAVMLMLALISIAGMPYSVLMPIFADHILHGGARGLGILMGATGLGAMAGAVSLASRSETRGLGKTIAWSAAGFGSALILFSISHRFWVSALLLFPTGFCFMLQMASTNTLMQTMVPDHLRGRVMAVHIMTFMGMASIGSLMAGSIAEKLGAPIVLTYGGLACLAGAVLLATQLPHLQLAASKSAKT